MKRTIIALAAVAAGLCAMAAVDIVALGHGETYNVDRPAKVIAVECNSTVANGTYNPKRERLAMSVRDVETVRYATNLTYSVVTTNIGATVTTTNVLAFPHPVPYPPLLKAYWTNTVVSVRRTTNRVSYVAAATTNAVAADSFLAPGDTVFTPSTDTFRGHVLIFIER